MVVVGRIGTNQPFPWRKGINGPIKPSWLSFCTGVFLLSPIHSWCWAAYTECKTGTDVWTLLLVAAELIMIK